MGQTLFMYFFPLGIAAAFVSAALVHFISAPRDGRRRRPAMALPLLIGIALLVALVGFSPSPWARWHLIDRALHTPASRVRSIELMPSEYHSRIDRTVRIEDAATLARIAGALNEADGHSPSHPRTRWNVLVRLTDVDGAQSTFTITQTNDANGTMIQFNSRAEGGWNLGTFRSDGLGDAIEDACRSAGL